MKNWETFAKETVVASSNYPKQFNFLYWGKACRALE
jgi:hypothetical protein